MPMPQSRSGSGLGGRPGDSPASTSEPPGDTSSAPAGDDLGRDRDPSEGLRRSPPQPDGIQLRDLYQSQRLRLTRQALLLVDDITSAEDVVQDAFVELHRRWDTLVNKDSAIAYLRVSVVNKARSALRRRRTARKYSGQYEGAHDEAVESVVLAEEHREVLAAVKRLSPRQGEILVLRYWWGMTNAEIADTLDISHGAVRSTAGRALRAMEQLLRREA